MTSPHGKDVQEQHFFYASVRLCVYRPFNCLSPFLLLNNLAEFNQTCYNTSPHVREQHYFPCVRRSVRPSSSICLSRYPLLNHCAEFNQTSCITYPHGKVCESNIFFPCVRRPSICPSRYLLLNHWTEFNQTCYITSPQQHYFSERPSSVHLSVTLSPPKPLGGNQPNLLAYMTSPNGKGMRKQHYFFSVRPSGVCPSVRHSISS